MADPARRRATYEDLAAVPAPLIAEILDGELVTQPRPAARHALVASAVAGEVWGPFHRGRGGPGGWIVLFEPELHLHGDVVVPDLAGWRRDRMSDVPETAAIELPPAWICEILSPRSAAIDRSVKREIYAREGVRWLWLVEPDTKTLEAFALDAGVWKLLGTWHADAAVRVAPFDAITIELAVFWRA
jgi:Uma2 family endonuclease